MLLFSWILYCSVFMMVDTAAVLLLLQFHYHLYWFYFDYLSSFSIIFPFRFRIMCHFICNHSLFGNVVLVCIMVSSFMLAAEDPLNANSEHNKVSNIFKTFATFLRKCYLIWGYCQIGNDNICAPWHFIAEHLKFNPLFMQSCLKRSRIGQESTI